MYLRISVFISFLCLPAYAALCQDENTCKVELKRVFVHMEDLFTDSSNVYLSYTLSNVLASDKSVQTDAVKIYLTDSMYIVTSSLSSYFSDLTDAFMVMPSQHKIYRVDVQSVKSRRNEQARLYRQSMIDSSRVISCTVLENGFKKITLELSSAYASTIQISTIQYLIDPVSNTLKECIIHYKQGYLLSYSSYRFLEIQTQVVLPFKGKVKQLFIQKNNTLTPTYSGYSYKDIRNYK